MKKVILITLLILAVVGSGYSYDFTQAGISLVGGAAGAYIGQSVSVPVLILLHNTSIIKEDIFSPFSTSIADAMETGSIVGAITGGITAKYVYRYIVYKNIDWLGLGVDTLITSAIVLVSHIAINKAAETIDIPPFLENIVIVPALEGIYLGFDIPCLL